MTFRTRRFLALAVCLAAAPLARASEADTLWNRYCNADGTVRRDSADLPKPNYEDPLVHAAADKLNRVRQINDATKAQLGSEWMDTFYFYGDIQSVYGVKGTKPAYTPDWVSADANAYLTIACGEFRDNVPMMERKIQWARDIVIVPKGKQTYSPDKGVWEQLTGEGYGKLVSVSGVLYGIRSAELDTKASETLGQKAVPGITGCEYRYLLKEYLAGDKKLKRAPEMPDNTYGWYTAEEIAQIQKERDEALAAYEGYKTGLAEFTAGTECSDTEKNSYNEFRGDGNFKVQSLESNAFIWNTRVYAKGCSALNKAKKKKGNLLTDADCETYFKAPWAGRADLTQQAAMRLFFYPESLDAVMQDTGSSLVLVTEDLNGDGVADLVTFDGNKPGAQKVLEARQDADNAQHEQDYTKVTQLRDQIYRTILKAATEQAHLDASYSAALASLDGSSDLDTSGITIVTGLHEGWNASMLESPDRGFASVFADPAKAWDRLATVLDRHTDWYQIDMVNLKAGVYQPTFSPWVASSYYINASDAFTNPGYAMGMQGDGMKHWMYVQRVSKDRWFNTDTMRSEWPKGIDLLNTWFDETTFSRSSLGAHERAWDRFGSVRPDEIETALWLYDSGLGAYGGGEEE